MIRVFIKEQPNIEYLDKLIINISFNYQKEYRFKHYIFNINQSKTFSCICGSVYAQKQGLYRHRKTCDAYNDQKISEKTPNQKSKEVLQSENKELQSENIKLQSENEELQSKNEELQSENTALQEQLQELTKRYNNLQNQTNKLLAEEQTKFINHLNEYQYNNGNPHAVVATNYVYLLQEREFTKTNELVYKIGMTTKENHKRFQQYLKGSVLIYQSLCKNCRDVEKRIITEFKKTFTQRTDIGTEYFEGDYSKMVNIIHWVVQHETNDCV